MKIGYISKKRMSKWRKPELMQKFKKQSVYFKSGRVITYYTNNQELLEYLYYHIHTTFHFKVKYYQLNTKP